MKKREKLSKKMRSRVTRFFTPKWKKEIYPTAHKEINLTQQERAALARNIRKTRTLDRKHARSGILENKPVFYSVSRNLNQVSSLHRLDVAGVLNYLIELYKKKSADVLDIGCGEGKALAELKKSAKAKIRTYGLALTRLGEQSKNIDKIIIGAAETKKLPEKRFLLVYSAESIFFDQLPLQSIERIINSLETGGVIITQMAPSRAIEEKLKNLEKENKIEYSITKIRRPSQHILGPPIEINTLIITRKTEKPISFS
ncbi:MAG: hypothetical protein COT90_00805 [Candidatus Diapherotrites archaeon CG10_big_fil_rev_8_21_14_0_10_31_34]|nr:MAG: hypothetical protein COT90_00805 [Candidatus Diapherotrites archaeon CG10_big_fil_rev_8_21_14_0_10_31_34]